MKKILRIIMIGLVMMTMKVNLSYGADATSDDWETRSGVTYINDGNAYGDVLRLQNGKLTFGSSWAKIQFNGKYEGVDKYVSSSSLSSFMWILNESTSKLQLWSAVAGTAGNAISYNTSTMSIDPNGNVGIGTTNPQKKLSVNGTIRAHELELTTNASDYPDFVFADNYKLMPLAELERSIKQNKHLPEIPTAEEVGKNGMSMGKMQVKLLQKVEELTLYVIEQDKKLARLEKENVNLKEKMMELEEK